MMCFPIFALTSLFSPVTNIAIINSVKELNINWEMKGRIVKASYCLNIFRGMSILAAHSKLGLCFSFVHLIAVIVICLQVRSLFSPFNLRDDAAKIASSIDITIHFQTAVAIVILFISIFAELNILKTYWKFLLLHYKLHLLYFYHIVPYYVWSFYICNRDQLTNNFLSLFRTILFDICCLHLKLRISILVIQCIYSCVLHDFDCEKDICVENYMNIFGTMTNSYCCLISINIIEAYQHYSGITWVGADAPRSAPLVPYPGYIPFGGLGHRIT